MTPKTKKILWISGGTLLLILAAIGGYRWYKNSTMTRDIDVTQLTPEQRKKLQEQGLTIPATGTVPVKLSDTTEVQRAKIVAQGRG